jgi:RNA polymerase sigma factor (TIGR02999 family)
MLHVSDGEQLITELLQRWSGGDREAFGQLVPLVYDELHRVAAGYLRAERREHTLQATALVNEAYLRLATSQPVPWKNRGQFYAVAAQVLRHILVDHARARDALKRQAGNNRATLEQALTVPVQPDLDLLALDESLNRLAEFDPKKARLVELRYFAGLSVLEVADALGVSPATVHREWTVARTWLYRNMMGSASASRTVAGD